MRNLILSITLAIITFFQLSANVAPKTATLDVIKNKKSVVLDLNDAQDDVTSLTIIDVTEDIIFTDVIEEDKKRITYELGNLPIGIYLIKIEGEAFTTFHEILITENLVSLLEEKTHYMPTIQYKGNKILTDASDEVQVTITNEYGDVVYTYNGMANVFNLEHLPQGNYDIIVSTDYFSNTQSIKI